MNLLNSGTIKVTEWRQNNPTPASPSEFEIVSISYDIIPRLIGGSTSTVFDRDCIFERVTNSSGYTDLQLKVFTSGIPESPATTWESSDNSIASVSSGGFVTHITNGHVIFTVTIDNISRSISYNFTTITEIMDKLVGYSTNTLARHVSYNIDSNIGGDLSSYGESNNTPNSKGISIFSSQNHVSGIYVRNPDAWCSPFVEQLTCISPYNTTGSNTRAGTAISPQHIIFAKHFEISSGARIRFISSDNSVIEKTMVSKLPISNADITIGLLDSDLPSSISHAKILPPNWRDFLPSMSSSKTVPCLSLDQEERALINELYLLSDRNVLFFNSPVTINYTRRKDFFENLIGGDSGNPSFLIINGEFVILSVWTSGGGGSGACISSYINEINDAMLSLNNGHQLSTVDLSGFTNFA